MRKLKKKQKTQKLALKILLSIETEIHNWGVAFEKTQEIFIKILTIKNMTFLRMTFLETNFVKTFPAREFPTTNSLH